MTPAQKRNDNDLELAYNIELVARALLECMNKAEEQGLHVNCNVGDRYSHSIGGYVKVYRHLKTKAIRVLIVDELRPRNKITPLGGEK